MSGELDELFGTLRAPERVDVWEVGREPMSRAKLQDAAGILRTLSDLASSKLMRAALRAKNFLWVVNGEGEIVEAIEELALSQPDAPYAGYPRRRSYRHPSEEKKLGHPTLLNGDNARIAGELAFDDDPAGGKLRWVLNANSGRYCRQRPPKKQQIDNVATEFRKLEIDVTVDYD